MTAKIKKQTETLFEANLVICSIEHGPPRFLELEDLLDLRAELAACKEWIEGSLTAVSTEIDKQQRDNYGIPPST